MTEPIATNEVTPNETQQPAQSDTQQSQQNEDVQTQSDIIQLTPAQLKQRLDRAQSSVLNGVLETLGVESVDTLKATLEAERKRKEAEMSETEKLQAELDALKQSMADKDAALVQAQQQRLDDMRDNGVLQLLGKAHSPQSVLILLKAQHDLSGIVTDGKFNSDEATKLISEFETSNGHMFKSSSAGSLSNRDGRVTPPTDKELEKIRNQVQQKRGKW